MSSIAISIERYVFARISIVDEKLVAVIAKEVKEKLAKEGSGHDWWHVYRVWGMAKRIGGREEDANMLIVNLSALLHDIADWKLHGGDESVGPRVAREILQKYAVNEETISQVCKIIMEISFKGARVASRPSTLEGMVVQDADRLDAIGAIGIGRAFAYGGNMGRLIYDPSIKPVMHVSKEEYVYNNSTSINHFYEKLLLLQDLMNTKTAKKIAKGRHKFMEQFLDRFFKEWECGW